MILTIYSKDGTKRADIAPNDSSTQQKEISGGNVLALSFTHYEYLALDVNDYVDFLGERYWLTEKYVPKEKSRGEWVYDVKLYGVESMLGRFLTVNDEDGKWEPVFTLTDSAYDHLSMITDCINRGMNGIVVLSPGAVVGSGEITIDYDGKYCDESLRELAGKAGLKAEWWVAGGYVNVSRCVYGSMVTLGYGNGLTEVEKDMASVPKFYTRLWPIGSSRNIDPEKYGHDRLMMPGERQYVDIGVGEYGVYDHYEKEAFDAIFPMYEGTVGEVRTEEKTDEWGNRLTVYYFKDEGMAFDPNEYELPGEVKRVSFQSGELEGLGTGDDHYFEVNYDSGTKEFEIIAIPTDEPDAKEEQPEEQPEEEGTTGGNRDAGSESGGPGDGTGGEGAGTGGEEPGDGEEEEEKPEKEITYLPGGKLIPKKGDKYFPWNMGMPKEYYANAEYELWKAAERYNSEHWNDIGLYRARTDHVWMEQHGEYLHVGQPVRLESREYFPDLGYRESRIVKITRKVNLPYQMDIEISDALHRGAMDRVNDSLSEMKKYVREQSEGAARHDIIRSMDDTPPTDSNVYSARRSRKEFLSKVKDDTAQGIITFLKGALWGKFTAETGAAMTVDAKTGQTRLEVDRLKVRLKAYFEQLEVQKVSYSGGKIVVTKGQGVKILSVEAMGDEAGNVTGWRCYFLGEQEGMGIDNLLSVGDQMICKTDNLQAGSSAGASNRYYWRLVTAVSSETVKKGTDVCHWVELSATDCDEGSDIPAAGDTICQLGSRTEADRQSAIIISVTDAISPSMVFYAGIDGYSLDGREYIEMGVTGGRSFMNVYGDTYIGDRKDKKDGHHIEWKDDRLEIKGKLSVGSSVGDKTLGDIAEDAEKGAVLVTITTDRGNVIFNGEGTRVLTAHVLKRNEDITDTIAQACFSWERTSNDETDDLIWNRLHRGIGNVCIVSDADIVRSALFTCVVDDIYEH